MERVVNIIGDVVYTTTIQDPVAEKEAQIIQLEAELVNMIEPSDEELIEHGKMMHPYYELVMRLDELKNRI